MKVTRRELLVAGVAAIALRTTKARADRAPQPTAQQQPATQPKSPIIWIGHC